jgi:hypothetical protein
MKKGKGQELILKVGAAGGSLSVWSVIAKDGTRFKFLNLPLRIKHIFAFASLWPRITAFPVVCSRLNQPPERYR